MEMTPQFRQELHRMFRLHGLLGQMTYYELEHLFAILLDVDPSEHPELEEFLDAVRDLTADDLPDTLTDDKEANDGTTPA